MGNPQAWVGPPPFCPGQKRVGTEGFCSEKTPSRRRSGPPHSSSSAVWYRTDSVGSDRFLIRTATSGQSVCAPLVDLLRRVSIENINKALYIRQSSRICGKAKRRLTITKDLRNPTART